jgi:glycine cleavage system H lipoate-binding protein
MQVEYCQFPDDILYDIENFVWIKMLEDDGITKSGNAIIGITPILTSLAGRILKIRLKSINNMIYKGKSIGTLESNRYFGVIRAPVNGRILKINERIIKDPKLTNDFPYTEGWIVKMAIQPLSENTNELKNIVDIEETVRKIIRELNVRCFSTTPDIEMIELGSECSAVLTKLDDLMTSLDSGKVVHLVSDNPYASTDVYLQTYMRWSSFAGYQLMDMRKEGNIFHFVIKK